MEKSKSSANHSKSAKKSKKVKSFSNQSSQELKDTEKALKKELADLDKQIELLNSEGITDDLREQMQALHEYNDAKDICQVILGYLADVEHTHLKDLHMRYNLPLDE